MQLRAYAIYDRKSVAYHTPFFAAAEGAAIRSFSDLVNDKNTSVGRHPTDYVLFFIGVYDDQSGTMVPVAPIVHVIDANALVKEQLPLFAQATTVDGLKAAVAASNGEEA